MKTIFLFLLVLLIGSYSAYSQKSKNPQKVEVDTIYHITTYDGVQYSGKLKSKSDSMIVITDEDNSEVSIKMSAIQVQKLVINKKGGAGHSFNSKYGFDNPLPSKGLLLSNAIPMKSGEAYYQNTYIVLHSVGFGITDNFSCNFYLETISLFTGHPIALINPKLNFNIAKDLYAGVGIIYGGMFFEREASGTGGAGFGMVTYGTYDDNVTAGLGYGLSSGNIVTNSLMIPISGMFRLGKHTQFVTENWIIPESSEATIFSYAIRLIYEDYSFDIGFINNSTLSQAIFIGIPYVDFMVKF